MLNRINEMNSFGTRLTGSEGQKKFISSLKNEIRKMGLETYSDPFYFRRWEEKEHRLYIKEDEDFLEMHISSAFPYSGKTPEEGITAELRFVAEKHIGFTGCAGKIAVVNIEELDFLPSTLAFHKKREYPEGTDIPEKYDGPVATSFVNFPFLQLAKTAGCKAVICIWRGMPDAMIEGQYLPFILGYQDIPAVWVNSTDGDRLIDAAKQRRVCNLVLNAVSEKNAYTETFYTVIPGRSTGEAVIINTHTDGTNCIEENGPVALLSLIDYFKDKTPEKTLIFLFVTGHFRLPSFKDIAGGGVQATSKWLAMHKELWDGKNGHLKAVACVSVEHLGALEWKDIDGEYKYTGKIDTELVYTGNKTLDDIYFDEITGREKVRTLTLRGHNFLHFGEGQPPFNCGIPEISLVTAPDYLTAVAQNHEMDKFDIDLMYEQTDTFIRIIRRLDEMPGDEIGPCDGYSMVFPNGEPAVYRLAKKIFG